MSLILRDPVHGLIAFEGAAQQILTRLLATREVQRLRHVRQLGLTSLVFPSAEHSRFTHSLGATSVMVRMLTRMRAMSAALPADQRVDDEAAADAIAAALLHDLGHGPFSHLFEDVLPEARRHEDWTQDILLEPSTDVHRVLEGTSTGMAQRVAGLIDGQHRLGYLGRCVSGTVDADRCDYLLRDSHMTGVGYGVYDLEWLLNSLRFAQLPDAGEWVLAVDGHKGLPPIEGFFLARQFMYQQVYHHKATRAAEALIRSIFVRVAELAREGATTVELPQALRRAALGETVALGEYLALDDIALMGCLRVWEGGADVVLSGLAARLLRRELPKTIALGSEGRHAEWERALAQAREIAARRGLRAELSVSLDVVTDIPYEEPDEISPDGLWVMMSERSRGELRSAALLERLGRVSFLLGQLRNRGVDRPLLIVPSEIRAEVVAALGTPTT